MTVYYPGYTHLLASSRDNRFSPYRCRLTKNYIRAVLQDLHDKAHHVHVFLENLPENRFGVVRYYDHVRSLIRPDTLLESDHLTLGVFLRYFDLFHPQDLFRIVFYTEVFGNEEEFTTEALVKVYRLCRNYLREQGLEHE